MAKRKYTFTKAQMETLKKYESDLSTAFHSNYCCAITSGEAKVVQSILEEATGARLDANSSCGSCTLRLMKTAGRLYFAQKDAEEADKKAETKQE